MKKILFALSLALLAVGCNDKDEFKPTKGSNPLNVSLTYDNAKTFSSNTLNRSLVYDVNGEQIKISVLADDKDNFYISAAALDEKADTQLLDCQIAELVDEVSNVGQIDIASIPDDGAFVGQALLPEATELQDKKEEDDPNIWNAVETKGYIVRYVSDDGNKELYFAVVVNTLAMTETVTETTVDIPFEGGESESVTFTEKTYSVTANISHKAFNRNGWIN